MQTVEIRENLQEVVEALRAALGDRLVAVILFGSRARGDARPDSDWDVLIVAQDLPCGTLDRHLTLKRALPKAWCGLVSVVSATPEELSTNTGSIDLDIALDGIVLYDVAGFAARWLARLRDTIERKGLHRERTPWGDVWQRRQPPTGLWSLENE